MEIVNLKGGLKYINNKIYIYQNFTKSPTLEKQEISFIAGKDAKWYIALEDSWAVSYKAKHILSHKSVIVLQGFYPTNLKTYVHTKSCT